jgi:hypothetical protein
MTWTTTTFEGPAWWSIQVQVTPAMLKVLLDLEEALGVSVPEVLRRAIALVKATVDADKEGHSLVLVDAEGKIVNRIVGILKEKG